MPPDRGALKQSSHSTKQPNITAQSKSVKDDAKNPHSKYELHRGKGSNNTRDLLTSHATKERSQKEDHKPRPSVREKLEVLKSEVEKVKVSSNIVKQDRVRPREPHTSSHMTKETSDKNVKSMSILSQPPGKNLATGGETSRRTEQSHRTSRTAEKPKVTSSTSKGHVKKNEAPSAGLHTRRSDSRHQASTQREAVKTEKLPNKIKHPGERGQNRDLGRQTGRVDKPSRLGRDRTRTRTLSPREVKFTRSGPEGERVQNQRLRQEQKQVFESTAAVSAVTTDSFPQGNDNNDEQKEEHDDDDNDDGGYKYEDDFEDYESDFEDSAASDMSDEGADIRNDDNSSSDDTESEVVELTPRHHPFVEEEKKLDSGNYDLADRRQKTREIQELKMALDRENVALSAHQRIKSQTGEHHIVPSDEGYEEGKVDDKKFPTAVTHLNFINFTNARKRKQEKKATATAKKRGEELLDMIRLDTVNFTLFELAPVPYEVYMKTYGCSDTLQAHVQTNEDNLSEEVQTDEIKYKNKWTQKPVSFQTRKSSVDEITLYSQDHLGVGGDSVEDDCDSWKERLKVDTVRLSQFLLSAGQVVLVLLEEREMPCANKLNKNMMDIPFSDGYISLGVESVPLLADRPISIVCFPRHHANVLLTVHNNIAFGDRQAENLSLCHSMIAIWSILEPSLPQKILVAVCEITAACFNTATANTVFAGHEDGSLCMWDLREKSHCHQVVETEHGEWVLRSPTYNTAEILKDKGHLGKIVALQPLVGTEVESYVSEASELSPTQICSLDEAGTIIVWSVIQSYKQGHLNGMPYQDLGLAHWGRVRLVCSSAFSLTDTIPLDHNLRFNLTCSDLQLDARDHTHLYIGTNTGYVVHSLKSGGKPTPQFYIPNVDEFAEVKCIEACPYGEPYFLVGCGMGTVRLHSQASDKPLATLAGTGDPIGEGQPVVAIQWSHSKPFIFFALDSSSRIHVWDLNRSDIYPMYTVPFGTVTAMQLSPHVGDTKNSPYLALATGPGRVEVHQLKQEYYSQTPDEISREMEKFVHYTSRL